MKINEVEKATGIRDANIRFYEKEGLISPSRNSNGYREYSESDVRRIEQIKVLRLLEIPIPVIRKLLEDEVSLRQVLEERLEDMEIETKRLGELRSSCENILSSNLDVADLNEDILSGGRSAWSSRLDTIIKEDIDKVFIAKGILFLIPFAFMLKMAVYVNTGHLFEETDLVFPMALGVIMILFGLAFSVMEGLMNLDFIYVYGKDWGGGGLGGLTNSYSILGIGVGLAGITWGLWVALLIGCLVLSSLIRMSLMYLTKEAERKNRKIRKWLWMLVTIAILIPVGVISIMMIFR